MNDMRLPAVSLANNEPSTNQANDAPRDPAQAFDAVMSRFSSSKPASSQPAPAPAPSNTSNTNNKSASNGKNNAGAANSTSGPNNAKNTKSANSASGANSSTQGKAPAASGDRTTQPDGQPVARTKPKDADDDLEATDAAANTANATPGAIVQAVTDAVQIAAQNPALAAAVASSVAAPVTGKDEKVADAPAAPSAALDVLASQAKALPARGTDKLASDPRAAAASDENTPPVSGGARTPVAAKDTLRIEAPPQRAIETMKTDLGNRLAAVADNVAEATTSRSATAPTTEVSAQAIATAVAGATTAPAATYSIAHAAVASPVGSSGFANELAQRVVVFAGQKVQRADIAVTPPDLGPIAVSIEVRGQEATLAFAASSHATRAAIEDALPRLRDMLSAQGLQLAGAHVGSEPRRESYRPAREQQNARGNATSREGISSVAAPATTPVRRTVNLIDIEV